MLDILLRSDNYHDIAFGQLVHGSWRHKDTAIAVDGHDTAAKTGPRVEVAETFLVQASGDVHFYDTVLLRQLDIIQQIGSDQLMRNANPHVPFGIDDPVNAQLLQGPAVQNGYRLGYHGIHA
ncbi:hypothetical protein D3C81_1591250 [compost metagenome]